MSDGVVFTSGRWNGCGLEDHAVAVTSAEPTAPSTPAGPGSPRGSESVMVLYRVEEKAVPKIRIFSPECELDAGGRTIQWLDGVKGADSVTLLTTFVSHQRNRRRTA